MTIVVGPPVMHVMHARLSDTPQPHLSRDRVSPGLFVVSCGSFVNSAAKVATCLRGGPEHLLNRHPILISELVFQLIPQTELVSDGVLAWN